MVSPTDHMLESLSSTIIEHPVSDEHNLSLIDSSKRKIVSKRQNNRYHRLKPSSVENLALTIKPINQTKVIMSDEQSTDSIWTSSGT